MRPLSVWLSSLALLAPAAGFAQLPPGISGAWYNPDQSGHGLSIEILDDERALAFWYVYDPQGNPVHLYLDGRIQGRTIEATAYAPSGMRFGTFRSEDLQLPAWGEVVIEFDQCDSARLHWNSSVQGYGRGDIELARLTRISGLDCSFTAEDATGIGQLVDANGRSAFRYVAVDRAQRLWALQTLAVAEDAIPGRGYVGNDTSRVLSADLGSAVVTAWSSSANWYWPGANPLQADTGRWQPASAADQARLTLNALTEGRALSFEQATAEQVRLETIASAAGVYQVTMRAQFFSTLHILTVGAEGRLCLEMQWEPGSCRIEGRLSIAADTPGLMEFAVRDSEVAAAADMSGRAWLQVEEGETRLILVGGNAERGFGLVGLRQL